MPTGTDRKKQTKAINALSLQAGDQERGSLVITKRRRYPESHSETPHDKPNKFSKMCLNDPKEGIPQNRTNNFFKKKEDLSPSKSIIVLNISDRNHQLKVRECKIDFKT